MLRWLVPFCLLATSLAAEGLDEFDSKQPGAPGWGAWAKSLWAGEEPRSIALLVGISDYDHYDDLATQNDVAEMRQFLVEEAGYDHVHVLTGDKVTLPRLRSLMIRELPAMMGPQDRFLFYWSGHGVTKHGRSGEIGYLPLAGSGEGMHDTMLDMSDIRDWDLKHIPAEQVLYLIDACFSGIVDITYKSARPDELTLQQMAGKARHVLTAGTGEQETIAIRSTRQSVFTTAVLEGLRGAADTTSAFERDGIVTVNELEDYVKKRVGQIAADVAPSMRITPQLRDLDINEGEYFFRVPGVVPAALAELEGADGGFVEAKGVASDPDIAALLARIEELERRTRQEETEPEGVVQDEETLAEDLRAPPEDEPPEQQVAALAPPRARPEAEVNAEATPDTAGFRDCPACPEMLELPGGTFTMGGTGKDEGGLRDITLAPFAMARSEISLAEFLASGVEPDTDCYAWTANAKLRLNRDVSYLTPDFGIMDPGGGGSPDNQMIGNRFADARYLDYPAACVSGRDAQAYVDWVNRQVEGSPYRLPSEAEFEYAIRQVLAEPPSTRRTHELAWNTQDSPTPYQLQDVTLADARTGWAVGGFFGGTILATADGGATWTTQDSPASGNLRAVTFADALTGWAVGDQSAVLATADGGATWTTQDIPTFESLTAVSFTDAQTGWAVGWSGSILATHDGGSTWTIQDSPISETLNAITFTDAQTGWAVGANGTIIATRDGSAWDIQDSPTSKSLRDITFIGAQTGWIVGHSGTILATRDGGDTWDSQDSPTSKHLFAVTFIDPQTGWVVGDSGTILATQDGGDTWDIQDNPISEPLYAIAFTDTQTGWVVGHNGTILATATDSATVCGGINAAGMESAFPWRADTCDDGYAMAAPVFAPEFGGSDPAALVHVLGNLWEWTADCWNASHGGLAADGRARTDGECGSRVVRGASYDDPERNLRPAYRAGIPRDRRQQNVGFRVVRDLD